MKALGTALPKRHGDLQTSCVRWNDRRPATRVRLSLVALLTVPAFFVLATPVLASTSGGCTYVSPGMATVAGILAIVAAVVAIVNAATKVPVKPESEEDSRRVIGYIQARFRPRCGRRATSPPVLCS